MAHSAHGADGTHGADETVSAHELHENWLSPTSSELVDRGDLDDLTRHVNRLVAEGSWAELSALRDVCRSALERGKQLWAVSAHIEYRLCLQAPGDWAARMLETGSGRFALGPLGEVAASAHAWKDLAPFLSSTPQAAMFAHERVLRGEDLSSDPSARELPEVLDLPFRLEPWEPRYALAEYQADRAQFPMPPMPTMLPLRGPRPPGPGPRTVPPASARLGVHGSLAGHEPPTPAYRQSDDVCTALEELVGAWTAGSNGRAVAGGVDGSAVQAICALGARPSELVALHPATALAAMAWAAASGGARGRRPGGAAGRFAAWWVVVAAAGLAASFPLAAEQVGRALAGQRWFAWGSGEPATGWALRLAVEARDGPLEGRAWALAATDAA